MCRLRFLFVDRMSLNGASPGPLPSPPLPNFTSHHITISHSASPLPLGLRTSVGFLGSDETLLREIDSRVFEWSKKSGQLLINGDIDDYRLHKIQVSQSESDTPPSSLTSSSLSSLVIRSLHFKNGEDKLFLINNSKILMLVSQPLN